MGKDEHRVQRPQGIAKLRSFFFGFFLVLHCCESFGDSQRLGWTVSPKMKESVQELLTPEVRSVQWAPPGSSTPLCTSLSYIADKQLVASGTVNGISAFSFSCQYSKKMKHTLLNLWFHFQSTADLYGSFVVCTR